MVVEVRPFGRACLALSEVILVGIFVLTRISFESLFLYTVGAWPL